MTVDLAFAHGRQGIRVNAILPGHLTTPIATSILAPAPRADYVESIRAEAGLPVDAGVTSVGPLSMLPFLAAVPEPSP